MTNQHYFIFGCHTCGAERVWGCAGGPADAPSPTSALLECHGCRKSMQHSFTRVNYGWVGPSPKLADVPMHLRGVSQ